jgi:hypothetical protein
MVSQNEKKLSAPLPKLAAGECLVERIAKFMDTEGFVEKLQAVLGCIPHNGVIPRDHYYGEPKPLCMRGEGGACLVLHGCVNNDRIDAVVLQDLPHRSTTLRGTHPITGILKYGRDRVSYQAFTINDKDLLLIGQEARPALAFVKA